jgi:glycosyltransferase involved in cell wall biosynthesis
VVATSAVGNRDLILPGETGYIADDPKAFINVLQKLANSKELRHQFGIAGRNRVADEFDPTRLAVRWMDLYAQTRARMLRIDHAAAPTLNRSRTNFRLKP